MSEENEPQSVTVRAPAKVNVYFRVGPLQPDGYHDVASLYQAVSVYEDLVATESKDFALSFTGSIDTSGLATDDSNLAMRAAKLLAAHANVDRGVTLTISKNVPIAGGMGGGSADAAAALVACDALWHTNLTKEELAALGSQLGADVPFALIGGTAVGTGRGDELSPALATGSFDWVLVFPGTQLSTPVVYRTLDEQRDAQQFDISPSIDAPAVETEVLQAIRLGDAHGLAATMHNDLEPASIALAPELADLLTLGKENGALNGIVSGSGPTLAFLAADTDAARALQRVFEERGVQALCAHGPVQGARVLNTNPSDHPSNHLNTRPVTVPINLPSPEQLRARADQKRGKKSRFKHKF